MSFYPVLISNMVLVTKRFGKAQLVIFFLLPLTNEQFLAIK